MIVRSTAPSEIREDEDLADDIGDLAARKSVDAGQSGDIGLHPRPEGRARHPSGQLGEGGFRPALTDPSAQVATKAGALHRRSCRSSSSVACIASPARAAARQTLRNWAKQTHVDEGRAHGLSSEEREELRRLRREVATLREEREILKKAAAFFAKESGTR